MIKINALYLAIFPAYKVDHLINEIGIIYALVKSNYKPIKRDYDNDRNKNTCARVFGRLA